MSFVPEIWACKRGWASTSEPLSCGARGRPARSAWRYRPCTRSWRHRPDCFARAPALAAHGIMEDCKLLCSSASWCEAATNREHRFPLPNLGRIRVDVRRDLVGTRCSASVLGLSSRTRGSASLPFDFFTAPGLRGDRSRNCGAATLVAIIFDPPAFQSAPVACPVRRARVPR